MKKIGVITFHKAYNYGAALQAFATVNLLKEYGFEAQIIDYYSNNLQGYGSIKNAFLAASNEGRPLLLKIVYALIKTPSYKKLKKQFDYFVEKELPITKAYFSSEELKADLPDCDYFCTGSDQVWNNYYTHYFDGAYFLDFVPKNYTCFSIAASFGKDNFTSEELSYIKTQLMRYDFISIRENTGLKIVHQLGFPDAISMLDPTLLVNKSVWDSFARNSRIKDKYILVYQLHGDSHAYDLAKEYKKRSGLKVVRIITMFHQIRPGCFNIVIPQVQEFIGLIRDAEYVFTDSFHGTVFSLLFERKVGIAMPSKFSDRISTLLEAVGTEELAVRNIDKWEKYVNSINYGVVGDKLNQLCNTNRKRLSDYLESLE